MSFPIKNRSKQQNMHITNFQYENDKSLKQETFMLCFDLEKSLLEQRGPQDESTASMEDAKRAEDEAHESYNQRRIRFSHRGLLNQSRSGIQITDGMTGRQFLFKIQGYVHGQNVFTDHIHYLLKGGKLMKCALNTINKYRQISSEISIQQQRIQKGEVIPQVDGSAAFDQRTFVYEEKGRHQNGRACRIHELPMFEPGYNGRRINYLRKRNFLVKATDLPKQFGFEIEVKKLHLDEKQPVLAKHLVIGDSCIKKLFFVFNINDYLLKDNYEYHHGVQPPELFSQIFDPTSSFDVGPTIQG